MTDQDKTSFWKFLFSGKNNFALLGILLQAIVLIAFLLTGFSSSTEVVVIYALETILIGIFHVFKMLLLIKNKQGKEAGFDRPKAIGIILFFIVHYGMFVFIQTTFFFVFMSMGDSRISDEIGLTNFIKVIQFPGVQTAAIVIVISLLLKFFAGIQKGRYTDVNFKLFMFVPYLRIFVQQFTAILPGFFVLFFHGGIAAALILIIFRTGLDLIMLKLREEPGNIDRLVNYLVLRSKKSYTETDKENFRKYLQLTLEE